MANATVCQSKWIPIVEPRRAKPKTYRQAPTHWLKFYEEAVIESEARTAVAETIDAQREKNCYRGTALERSVGKYWGLNQFYLRETSLLILIQLQMTNTVELQLLEYLWDHGKSFEIWVVRATEG